MLNMIRLDSTLTVFLLYLSTRHKNKSTPPPIYLSWQQSWCLYLAPVYCTVRTWAHNIPKIKHWDIQAQFMAPNPHCGTLCYYFTAPATPRNVVGACRRLGHSRTLDYQSIGSLDCSPESKAREQWEVLWDRHLGLQHTELGVSSPSSHAWPLCATGWSTITFPDTRSLFQAGHSQSLYHAAK